MSKESLFSLAIENKSKFVIPKVALVIATHPDDAEINAAGLTTALVENGTSVHYLICSNGNTGTWDKSMSAEQLAQVRQLEQQEAADMLGVSSVSFLNIPDGYVREADSYLKESIARALRLVKPQMVVTHDPWKQYDFNDDHRAVGFAAAHAVLLAPNYLYAASQIDDEGLDPHFSRMVTFFNTDNPNLWVDITDYYVRKEESIRAHRSQFGDRKKFFIELERNAKMEGERIDKEYAESHHLRFNS